MRRNHKRIDRFKHYDVVVYASRGSNSARRLASALGCRRWRDDLPERYARRRPYFRGNRSPLVINWGSTRPAEWLSDPRFRLTPKWINSAEAVSRAIDKRAFFSVFSKRDDVRVLRSTTDVKEVEKWLKKGYKVVARKNITGSGGQGIVIISPVAGGAVPKVPDAPLYTRYFPKTHEFRCHIWDGKLIDFTQKKLKGGPDETANRVVRNLDNGWIFAHGALDLGQADISTLGNSAVRCLAGLGLSFGAVDILAILTPDRRLQDYRICEVNTGPGLENEQTIKAYAEAILQTKAASSRSAKLVAQQR